jgi:Uma2 family endonuclease
MADPLGKTENYTYLDYLKMNDGNRYEVIDGQLFMMASPSDWHQKMVMDVSWQLYNFFRGKPCQVRTAPFDVRLSPKSDKSDNIVVQPDIMVICDREKLSDGKACRGAPDFIIEILSSGSRSNDLIEKRSRYEKAGVREYWVVGMDVVFKYKLIDDVYIETIYNIKADILKVPVDIFDGCVVSFDSDNSV